MTEVAVAQADHGPDHRRPRQLLPRAADGADPWHPREPSRARCSPCGRADTGSRTDIPKWVAKAGHTLVGLVAREGYDEIVVEKTH